MENHEREEIKDFASDTLYPLFLHCAHMLGRGHHHCTASHPSQHRILSLLSEKESIPQQELLEILDIRASSLSELLSKLEDKGLITRTKPDHAKRNVNVEITDLGAAVAEEHAQHKEEAAQELFASLSEEEQKTLAGLLEKLFMTGTDGIMETEKDITAVIIMKDTERVTAADVTAGERPPSPSWELSAPGGMLNKVTSDIKKQETAMNLSFIAVPAFIV